MPVVTRYALRSKTSSAGNNSNPTTNAAPVISETTTNARPVLGEVAGNSEASTAPDDQTTQEEPAKKSTAKGNSAAINANSKIETTQQGIGNTSVVLPEEENDGPLPVEEAVGDSEAVDGIPEAMLGEGHQKGTGMSPKPEDGGALNVQSPSGKLTDSRLSPSEYKTPKFDPNVHISPATDSMAEEEEDSFVKSIVKRSPRTLADGGDLSDVPEYSISPSRQPSRIEDSVEAIDALEDALEKIGQALPNIDNGFDSPVRGPSPTEPVGNLEVEKRSNQARGAKANVSSIRNKKRAEPKVKPTKPEPPTTRRMAASNTLQAGRNLARGTHRSQAAATPARTGSPRKPENKLATTASALTKKAEKSATPTATANEVKTPTAKKETPRVDPSSLSTSKPGFVPAKSTRAPTRPTFELPGEAISRRKREKLEEKARQEEEEKQRRRTFKARPARISSVPSVAVKETASSRNRARASLIGDDLAREAEGQAAASGSASKRHSSLATPARTSSFQSVESTASKRKSLLGVSKRSSMTSLATQASSASRAPAAGSEEVDQDGVVDATPTRKGNTAVNPVNSTAYQKGRGKEIFRRDQLQKGERERERREKEEAAKRARAEAAERGRQASREWAERQRLRKAQGN